MGNRAVFILGVTSAAPGKTGGRYAVDMHCKLGMRHDKKQKIRIIRVNIRFGAGVSPLQPMGFRIGGESAR